MKEKRAKGLLALFLSVLIIIMSIPALGVSAEFVVDDIEYEWYGDLVTIKDYHGTATELDIPDTVNGKTVAYIDNYAFSNCSSLTSVTIPDTVIETGVGVFSDCENLESVTINCNIDDIKDKMFSNCKKLKEIHLEYDPLRINEEAFYGCESLERFDISCMYIGKNAFNGCISLADISLEMYGSEIIEQDAFINTEYYNDLSNWEDGTLYIDTALIASNADGDYIVKDGTETIADYAFDGCDKLESVIIPETVINLGKFAFKDCANLKSAELPQYVSDIPAGLFKNCENLEDVNLPYYTNSIKSNSFENTKIVNDKSNWDGSLLYIDQALIAVDDNISGECIVKDGTEVIADNAFYNCSKLESISIPDTVISIGNRAFYGCDSLKDLYIHTNEYCFGLETSFPKNVTIYGYEGSAVQALASLNDYSFVSMGECDGFVPESGVNGLYTDLQVGGTVKYIVTFADDYDYWKIGSVEANIKYDASKLKLLTIDRDEAFPAYKNCNEYGNSSSGIYNPDIPGDIYYVCITSNQWFKVNYNESFIELEFEVLDTGYTTIDFYSSLNVELEEMCIYSGDYEGDEPAEPNTGDVIIEYPDEPTDTTDVPGYDSTENPSDDTEPTTNESYWNVGTILKNDFIAYSGRSALEIAGIISTNDVITFLPVTMSVEEGYLAGFDEKIVGFQEAAVIEPLNGNIPFVGYVFTVNGNAYDFADSLVEKANPKWTITSEADLIICDVVDNQVFFLMCPESLELEPVVYDIGDVNRDEKINIKDATYIQKYCAKMADMDSEQAVLADFNLDSKINVKDATTIQKFIAGLI